MTRVPYISGENAIPADVSSCRIPKRPIPFLAISLGGSGAQILKAVKRTFADRFSCPQDQDKPCRTAYLHFDTDPHAGDSLADGEFVWLHSPALHEASKLQFQPSLTDSEREWVGSLLKERNWHQTRQGTRLIFSRCYEQVYTALSTALLSVADNSGTSNAQRKGPADIEIAVITGLCGKTGSGLFLDMTHFIRHVMRSHPALSGLHCHLTGYIVMPDVSLQACPETDIARRQMQANAYAALKELDFWMDPHKHRTPYTMAFANDIRIKDGWNLFDRCILLSGQTADGRTVDDPWDTISQTVADSLIQLLADTLQDYFHGRYDTILYASQHLGNMGIRKPYPLNYCYDAIGTCARRIPMQKILHIEATQLFSSFMPRRDDRGTYLTSDALLTDEYAAHRAKKILGDPEALYADFSAALPLPIFGNELSTEVIRHWASLSVLHTAEAAAGHYLTAAWLRFEDFCEAVMLHPQFGPFGLRNYLADPEKGLIFELEMQLTSWNRLSDSLSQKLDALQMKYEQAWQKCEHPPLLGRKRAKSEYILSAYDYTAGIRQSSFMGAHVKAARQLLQRIQDYLAQSLQPLCDDLAHLYDAFREMPADTSPRYADILDAETLRPRIVQQFATANEEQHISQNFLRALCRESLRYDPTTERDSAAFSYPTEGRPAVWALMKETLDSCFGCINSQSLDDLMLQASTDANIPLRDLIEKIADSVYQGAQPLFAQHPAFSAESSASSAFISLPDNAPMHLEHLSRNVLRSTEVLSPQRNQIFCLRIWSGLPLYRYALLPELYQAYQECLADPLASVGLHLVRSDHAGANCISDWEKLPDPAPFYFFSPHGSPAAESAWKDACQLAGRAIECGMIHVTLTGRNGDPESRIHQYRQGIPSTHLVPGSAMAEEVVNILRDVIDTDTQEYLTLAHKASKLSALLQEAETVTREISINPQVMTRCLGLIGKDCDPSDPAVAVDPLRLDAARSNHQQICAAVVAADLLQFPVLLQQVQDQIDGWEALSNALRISPEREPKPWTARFDHAATFAGMVVCGSLAITPESAGYTDDAGQTIPLMQGSVPSADLQALPFFSQVCAFAADLPEDSALRQHFDQQHKDWLDRMHKGQLTTADYKDAAQRCRIAQALCRRELDKAQQDLAQPDTDAVMLNRIIAMLSATAVSLHDEQCQMDLALQMNPDHN